MESNRKTTHFFALSPTKNSEFVLITIIYGKHDLHVQIVSFVSYGEQLAFSNLRFPHRSRPKTISSPVNEMSNAVCHPQVLIVISLCEVIHFQQHDFFISNSCQFQLREFLLQFHSSIVIVSIELYICRMLVYF